MQWGWLCLTLLPNQRMTSCSPECTCLDSIGKRTSVSLSIGSLLLSRPYWHWNLYFQSVYRRHLQVLVLLNSCHHPKINHKITAKAWHAPQFSSKTAFPKAASPFGSVTSGSFIYFFFLPPICFLINKNYNFVDLFFKF